MEEARNFTDDNIRQIIETPYIGEADEDYCNTQTIQVIRNLKNARLRCGLTIPQLADKADISRTYLYKLERYRGNISVNVLISLCHALNVRVSEIIPEDEMPEELSNAEIFDYLMKDMNEEDQNAVLEIVRMCSRWNGKETN